MAETRKGAITMKGNPVDLVGPELSPGAPAPDFSCVSKTDSGLATVSLADTAGKARLFSVVPSLDTPVCNTQTRTFAQKLASLGDKVAAHTVSMDLPFAMARFCGEANIANMTNLSDLHNHSFGTNYGVLMSGPPIPLLARAIFVVDAGGTITHVEYVPEVGQEPNYDAALQALEAAAKS